MIFALPLASAAVGAIGALMDLAPTEIIVSIMAANGAFLVAIFLVEG